MALLRALVVEDEWPARNYLVELLETSRAAQVVGAVASVDEARQALQTSSGLSVVDYLLKPFTEERVSQCLERLARQRRTRPEAPTTLRIVARRKRNLVFLEPAEIFAFEAATL